MSVCTRRDSLPPSLQPDSHLIHCLFRNKTQQQGEAKHNRLQTGGTPTIWMSAEAKPPLGLGFIIVSLSSFSYFVKGRHSLTSRRCSSCQTDYKHQHGLLCRLLPTQHPECINRTHTGHRLCPPRHPCAPPLQTKGDSRTLV